MKNGVSLCMPDDPFQRNLSGYEKKTPAGFNPAGDTENIMMFDSSCDLRILLPDQIDGGQQCNQVCWNPEIQDR